MKSHNEQYECPVCASDIEPHDLPMCQSELNKIKVDAVRKSAIFLGKLITAPPSKHASSIIAIEEYANKLEKGEL